MRYQYECPQCRELIEISKTMVDAKLEEKCLSCGVKLKRIFNTHPFQLEHKENLPLGNKSRGRYIKGEHNDILIPSFGLLEKEEIDYIAEANIEKDKNRKRKTPMKENMQKVVGALHQAPKGQRGKLLDELQGG